MTNEQVKYTYYYIHRTAAEFFEHFIMVHNYCDLTCLCGVKRYRRV